MITTSDFPIHLDPRVSRTSNGRYVIHPDPEHRDIVIQRNDGSGLSEDEARRSLDGLDLAIELRRARA